MSAQLPSPYPNGVSPGHDEGTGGSMLTAVQAPTQVVAPNGSFPTRQDPSFAELPAQREARTQLFVGNLPFRVRWQDLVRPFPGGRELEGRPEANGLLGVCRRI
jgi:hypothetical protein